MRPSTIPDEEIMEGHRRMVMGPPAGDDVTGEIRAVEMLMGTDEEHGSPVFRARIVLDDGDLERLTKGEPFWLSFWGHVVPFDVAFAEPVE